MSCGDIIDELPPRQGDFPHILPIIAGYFLHNLAVNWREKQEDGRLVVYG